MKELLDELHNRHLVLTGSLRDAVKEGGESDITQEWDQEAEEIDALFEKAKRQHQENEKYIIPMVK